MLDRADDSPVRDVFDVIAAASAEPGALSAAASALPAHETESNAATWRRQASRFADETAQAITSEPAHYEPVPLAANRSDSDQADDREDDRPGNATQS